MDHGSIHPSSLASLTGSFPALGYGGYGRVPDQPARPPGDGLGLFHPPVLGAVSGGDFFCLKSVWRAPTDRAVLGTGPGAVRSQRGRTHALYDRVRQQLAGWRAGGGGGGRPVLHRHLAHRADRGCPESYLAITLLAYLGPQVQ